MGGTVYCACVSGKEGLNCEDSCSGSCLTACDSGYNNAACLNGGVNIGYLSSLGTKQYCGCDCTATKYHGRECETLVPSYSIPCYVANNILTKTGEALDCKISIGTDYYSPAEVLVKNFQEIDADTLGVEIHLMGVLLPA